MVHGLGIFTKELGGSVNLAGHKVPIAFLGVIATIAAAILIIRARGGVSAGAGAQQIAAGQAAAGSGVFGGASGADASGSIQNLQTQLQGFLSGLSGLQTAGPATPAAPGVIAAAASGLASAVAAPNLLNSTLNQSGAPIPPESHHVSVADAFKAVAGAFAPRTGSALPSSAGLPAFIAGKPASPTSGNPGHVDPNPAYYSATIDVAKAIKSFFTPPRAAPAAPTVAVPTTAVHGAFA